MHLVYLVGRDREVFTSVRRCIEDAGYPVCWFLDPPGMLAAAVKHPPSLLIVHWEFSDASVLEACKLIRGSQLLRQVRLLVMGEHLTEELRIAAFDSGVDGCISQPINPRELLWNMAMLQVKTSREMAAQSRVNSLLKVADLAVDNSSMRVTYKGHVVETTALEFRVIEYLARHQGRVFTRNELLHAIWGEDYSGGPRSVDACIRRIRRKIEPDRRAPIYLKSIRGIGYRLDAGSHDA